MSFETDSKFEIGHELFRTSDLTRVALRQVLYLNNWFRQ
jgi:hypothetical protein